jgi:MarR family 2-MHQ and catechol resistance regulon transcriptional repressor
MGSHYRGNKEEIRALSAFINLTRASDSLIARQGRRLSAEGLTLTQWGVIEALFHLGSMCQKELGRKLLKSGGDITMVVKNLARRGLVQRNRDKDDRRLCEISLTSKGRRLVQRILERHVAGIVEDMGRLGAGELEQLRRMCRRLGIERADKKSD